MGEEELNFFFFWVVLLWLCTGRVFFGYVPSSFLMNIHAALAWFEKEKEKDGRKKS